jgi:signal peptidase I
MEISQQQAGSRKKRETWEWIKALLIAIGIALLIRTFIFSPYMVDGHSMDPTLQDRERLFVDKAVYYLHQPQRGDIIVFHATPERDFVKRVIGLPGETVEVRNDTLYINGKVVNEPYLEKRKEELKKSGQHLTEDFGPVTIPQGKIFVMGDNRPNSLDSRFQLGPVSLDKVVGRSEFVFWPMNQIGVK